MALIRKKKLVRVAVTGAGALLGQGIIRSLKSSGIATYTIAVDVNHLSAGLYWTDEAFLIPFAKSDNYLDSIRNLLSKTSPDILLIGTDVELAVLSAAKSAFEREFGTQILVSSPDVIAIADDKYKTNKFFAANNFAAPTSALIEDKAGIENLITQIGFPLIVKPRVGARSYGVSVTHNQKELEFAMAHIQNGLVQECVGHDGQEYTASGLHFDGKCDAVIVMRRDLRDGNTYRAYTVNDSELNNQVKNWTEALKPLGPANFQFRIDKNGVCKAFEINSRFSGTTPLRAHAGFNEVAMCIRKILWDEPITQPEIRPVVILRHWTETVIAGDNLIRDVSV
jgi:carbamoyl-phosphate synthase large subunit